MIALSFLFRYNRFHEATFSRPSREPLDAPARDGQMRHVSVKLHTRDEPASEAEALVGTSNCGTVTIEVIPLPKDPKKFRRVKRTFTAFDFFIREA